MSEDTQVVQHYAEEQGRARELKREEVITFCLVSLIKAAAVALVVFMLVMVVELFRDNLSPVSVVAITGGVFIIELAVFVLKDQDTLVDGLRQWRELKTYFPPIPQPEPKPSHPPIVVRPYQGEPYVLGQPERPALPGRQEALQITPPVVAELLRASLEEYGGKWSRRKLMALRIQGQSVSRGVYETVTSWLHKAGALIQTRQGGFTLPPDVTTFEDLRTYFPNLPGLGDLGETGRDGRETGRDGNGDSQLTHPASREVGTLAEQRRQKFVELGCDVVAYLEWRDNHDS